MTVRMMRTQVQAVWAVPLLMACATAAQAQSVVGLGLAAVPKYEGSRDYRALPLPILNYESGAFFIGSRTGLPGLGLKAKVAEEVTAGIYLSAGLGRDSSDHSHLRGLPDVKFHGLAGAFVEYSPGRASFSIDARQALKSGYGATVDLGASYAVFQSEASTIKLGVNTSWANDDYMDTWFGVSNASAARSREGLSAYSASSGFKSAALSSTWLYRFNKNWMTSTTVGVKTLLGDARDSSIVERKTSAFGVASVLYAF